MTRLKEQCDTHKCIRAVVVDRGTQPGHDLADVTR